MATPAAVLNILVKADTRPAQVALGKTNTALGATEKQSRRTSASMQRLGTAAKVGAGAGLFALGAGVKKAFGEFQEAQKVTRQTNAVLKSTGGAAKTTAREIENLAARLSRKSGIDDEAIQSGQNLLLTFTKIRNETGKGNQIFNRASTSILDMSVALGQDLKSSAIQVGKALNDPVKGITALRRVGVSFTQTQEDMVKGWAESGQTLKAQRFILRELRTEFGGSARAQATWTDKLRVAWDNLFESIGRVIGPKIQAGAEWLTRFINQMQTGRGRGGEFVDNLERAGNVIEGIWNVAKKIPPEAYALLGITVAGVKVNKALGGLPGKAVGGLAGKVASKATPVPVFVTNPGFGGGVGKPGGGGGPKIPPIVTRGIPAGARLVPVVAAGTVIAYVSAKVNRDLPTGGGAETRRAAGRRPGAGAAPVFAPRPQRTPDLADLKRPDESATAAMIGRIGALKKLREQLKMTNKTMNEFGINSTTRLRTVMNNSETFMAKVRKSLGTHSTAGRKLVEQNFRETATAIGKSMARGKISSDDGMKAINRLMKTHSGQGKRALTQNLIEAANNIKRSMKESGNTTRAGMQTIERLMVRALQGMGFTKEQALNVRAGRDPTSGKAIGGLGGKQRGGMIAGTGDGDRIPVMAEPGEGFINKKAVRALGGPKAINAINSAIPRFQAGGMVRVPGDPNTTGGRDLVASSIAQQVGSWIRRYKIQIGYAYDPGGGHRSSGHNVTGTALDVVPGIGGTWDTLEAGLKAAVAAGKTVYYGTNGIGTALANHGRGNHGHVEWGGGGAVGGSAPGIELGKKLKRMVVEGPNSLLKANVQGALDVGRAGANKVIERANRLAAASSGSAGPHDVPGEMGPAGTASRSQMVKWATEALHRTGHGASSEAIDKILTLAMKESSWQPRSINLWDSNAKAGNPSGGLMHVTIDKVGGKWPQDKEKLWDPIGNMIASINYQFGRYGGLVTHSPYREGGVVGYVGDSLGVGTAPILKRLLGRAVWGDSVVGRRSPAGVSVLAGMDKASQLVFDLGTNDPDAGVTRRALRRASGIAGKRPLHFLSLLGGPDMAGKNKMFRASPGGNEHLVDFAKAYKGAHDDIGHPSSYGQRAQMLARSIRSAAKSEKSKPPRGRRGNKKRDIPFGSGNPTLKMLGHTLGVLGKPGGDPGARTGALHDLLENIRSTGLPKSVGDQIGEWTGKVSDLEGFAQRAGQLTIDDGEGNVIPGTFRGHDEIYYTVQELSRLVELRNKVIGALEIVEKRRAQIARLVEAARERLQKVMDEIHKYAGIRAHYQKQLDEAKKKPQKNKDAIEHLKKVIGLIDEDQAGHVRVRKNLRTEIIPALTRKGSALGETHTGLADQLLEIHGPGSPMERMLAAPALRGGASLGGQIFDVQMRLEELNAPTTAATTAAEAAVGDSETADLLRQLLREANLRTAVSEAQADVLKGLPFAGSFATGGVVPGAIGAPQMAMVHGGETITPAGEANVHISFAGGMEWLAQFVDIRVNGQTRKATQRRPLPGQGGGVLRG